MARQSPELGNPPEFDYRLLWRSRHPRPGHHRSTLAGSGQEYRARVPLLDAPDPRRLALRSSAADPFGRLYVHVFNQYSTVPVYALVDTSASMDFVGASDKPALVRQFLFALAFSAYRTGDPCGLIACGAQRDAIRFLPATRNSALVRAEIAAWAANAPSASDAGGLRGAAALLGRHRALVFLVSDFRWPAGLLDTMIADLARHEVVPLVVRDSAEDLSQAPFGLARIVDNETGAERTLWIRKRTRRAAASAAAAQRARLVRDLRRHHREPLFVEDVLDRDRLNRYFTR